MSELRNTVDVSMGVVQVRVAGMAEALVPKESLSASVELVDAELMHYRGGDSAIESTDLGIGIGGEVTGVQRGRVGRQRKNKRCGVTETVAQNTMELNIFGATQGVVNDKREGTVLMVFLERSAGNMGATN
jgi:hypothetical protein